VALRLLATTWEEQEELVWLWLRLQGALAAVSDYLISQDGAAAALKKLNSRFEPEKPSRAPARPAARKGRVGTRMQKEDVLVFVEMRIVAHVLSAWICADAAPPASVRAT
jgi:hypothetical protein